MIKLWVLAYMLTSGHFGHMHFYGEEQCESAKSQLELSLSETDNPVEVAVCIFNEDPGRAV